MERIKILLQKLDELSKNGEKNSAIDIDLMLDYTKVLYADLLEWRKKSELHTSIISSTLQPEKKDIPTPQLQKSEPVKPIFTEQKNTAQEKDIHNQIGINDKLLFIGELFNNNKGLYKTTLDEINNFDNYQQTYNWLQSQYDWDEENETVQTFLNMLNVFFSTR